jgi:heat shock protein HslJ
MLIVALVAVLGMIGGGAPASAGGGEEGGIPRGVEWRAVEIDGAPVTEGVGSTLVVDESGRVSGRLGCNRMAGRLEGEGTRVSFGQFVATRMACAPPAMDQETRFEAALSAVRQAVVDSDGRLRLLDGEGRTRVLMAR